MWLWLVVCQVALVVGSTTLDVRLLNSRLASSQFECFDYSSALQLRSFDEGWRLPKKFSRVFQTSTPKYTSNYLPEFSRRFDIITSNNENDMIKEHAKLVQDINSLRQVMFVAPLTDDTKDYEDSIFHEILETSSTTTSRPKIPKPTRPKTGFPILLLGGASNKHSMKSYPNPTKLQKQSISLVGSSVSPVVRHPYPFVMAASSRQPVRICMSAPSYTTTRRPSLWERIVKSIIPR